MRFKISYSNEHQHKGAAVCVCWNNTEDVFSCGDDHKFLKWNLISGECQVITVFPDDFFPTWMHLYPKISVGAISNKQHNDIILITTADGKFHIVNQNGRQDKTVQAHKGACLSCQWSPDGAGFLTGGEDGLVKIWSRNGLLRSSVVHSDVPCYGVVWGPDSNSILYTNKNYLEIKNFSTNAKILKWKAHEALILCVAWNTNNNLIISGGEDAYFKVWDSYGQLLSISVKHEQPIMSLSWSPAGDLFVVAGYNLLRLCSASGWSHCLERPNSGGIHSVAWSSDGTQLAGACANSKLLFAHIIDRQLSWKSFTCTLSGRKAIILKDVTSDTTDQLDYPDRVIQLELGHGHLVVATGKQCYVHSMSSWNTPVVFDLKEGNISMILLSERCLAIVERSSVSVHTFLGRLVAAPRWPNMRPDCLGQGTIALGPDTLGVVDQSDKKAIHIFELPTGLIVRSSSEQSINKITHRMTVCEVALSQTGPVSERQLAILDYNRDLYIVTLKDIKLKFIKLGTQVLGACWSSESELLVGLRADSLVVWCCPRAAFQPDLLTLTTVQKEVSDLGRNPQIVSLDDGVANIYRSDGSLLHISLVPFPEKLLKHVAVNQWQQALKLCRSMEEETLWACLAALAWQYRELDVAEEAFAFIKHFHQVEYIQHLKSNTPEKISVRVY